MNSKILLSLACAAGLAATAHAQVFGPDTSRNVLLGGIVGAIIGDNNHHQAAAGAAIGATASYIWSQATGADSGACAPAVPVRRTTRVVTPAPCPTEEVVVVQEPRCPPPTRVVYVPDRPHRHGHYEKVIIVHDGGWREVRYVFVQDRPRYRDDDCDRDDRWHDRW